MAISSLARRLISWPIRNRLRGIQEAYRNARVRRRSGRPLPPAVESQLVKHMFLRPQLRELLEDSTWCIDEFRFDEQHVEIRGWALTPQDRYAPATFTLNGEPFDEIDFPRQRWDVANVFWYRLGTELCGFVCRKTLPAGSTLDDLFPGGFAELQFCNAQTGSPFRDGHGFYIAHPDKDAFPDPGEKRRLRVHGNTDLRSFLIQGSSAFVKLERALQKSVGKGYEAFPRVLDWGCGCGRVARYFRDLPDVALHGVDIDANNVEWCRENLGFGTFSSCRADPPMPYEDGSFDLVFGISVMTHLAEGDRTKWLHELDRITADGAVLLLSIQGTPALCRSRVETETLIRFRQSGFLDVDMSLAAEDLSSESDRYIDCFLSEDYVRHRWSEIFDVLDVLPGYIGNVQDLVVLRKRGG
jgi:SAM-dependent methyltransferase